MLFLPVVYTIQPLKQKTSLFYLNNIKVHNLSKLIPEDDQKEIKGRNHREVNIFPIRKSITHPPIL